ncbi:hypothetical protein LOD99_7012 [Oopsacas minuta]|uniref:sphingomyelin phosphodiesterase n=1 Tax=Oopsacas minuta TaxID=111878 RepID=A0AAV7JKK3_9METZ|nr:hypothetical protein LOD99_7012 [Oopsacas minuta]
MANRYPDASTQEQEHTLRILSQNIWGVYLGNHGPNFQTRLARLATAARDYDVILIQEFTLFKVLGLTLGATYMENFYQLISDYMPFSSINNISDSLPYLFGGNSGLIIFSRYPIISTQETAFTSYPWFESSYKGFQHVQIKIQRRKPVLLHVINTHLYAHWRPWVRPAQLQEIADYKKQFNEDELIIITGDFNICPRTHENAETQFKFMCDVMEPLKLCSNPLEVTYKSEGATFDHCFVGGADVLNVDVTPVEILYSARDEEQLPISDHKGLAIRLTIREYQ